MKFSWVLKCFFAFTAFSGPLLAMARPAPTPVHPTVRTLEMSPGRKLFVQSIAAADSTKPTLLLLPGVYRSLLLEEPAGQELAALGYGVVTVSYSTQPFSVATLKDQEVPYFQRHRIEIQDLADETEFIIQKLGGSVVPVSLSYSGAVSPYLKNSPLIIETVPMTSTAATNPTMEAYRLSLKPWEFFNPMGVRLALDAAYRQVWEPRVDQLLTQFNLNLNRKGDMVDGYVAMSRAAEGLSWDQLSLSVSARRVFILAENEAPSLKKNQLETFANFKKAQSAASLIVIRESGHVVPADQPAAYATALQMALDNANSGKILAITPSRHKTDELPAAWVAEQLRRL